MDTSNFSSEPPGNSGEDTSFSTPETPAPPASSESGQQEGAAPAAPNSRPNGGRNNFRNRRFRGRKQNRQGGGGQQNRGNGQSNGNRGVFTGPMDHSYRQQNNNDNANHQGQGSNRGGGFGRRNRFRQQFKGRKGSNQVAGYQGQNEIRPVDPAALHEDAATRIFAFVEDLFFMTKIMDTARKLNVKIAFVKTVEELMEKVEIHADEKPSLIIFDLNNANAKPLTTIPKVKSKLKKGTSILGFVSHVQGDLKMKAQDAGCDSVMPRSAFSQNLPALLRRHGAPEEPEQE
ncbi:MAG TPA: hypothetical protein VK699_08630 [Terriglobales bacterium]|jgi:hypothetical protein|nr:hypothetical protein [Terriglobales bacterium]